MQQADGRMLQELMGSAIYVCYAHVDAPDTVSQHDEVQSRRSSDVLCLTDAFM